MSIGAQPETGRSKKRDSSTARLPIRSRGSRTRSMRMPRFLSPFLRSQPCDSGGGQVRESRRRNRALPAHLWGVAGRCRCLGDSAGSRLDGDVRLRRAGTMTAVEGSEVNDTKRIIAAGYDQMGERSLSGTQNSRRTVEGGSSARCSRGFPRAATCSSSAADPAPIRRSCPPADATSAWISHTSCSRSPRNGHQARNIRARRSCVGRVPAAASFDGVVAFYVFNHVPLHEVEPAFAAAFAWLRPGGYLMLGGTPHDGSGGPRRGVVRCSDVLRRAYQTRRA